jgi:hypothetical protein
VGRLHSRRGEHSVYIATALAKMVVLGEGSPGTERYTSRMTHATDSFDDSVQRLRVDAAMDGYVGWREACAGVHHAYDGWRNAARDGAGRAFGSYMSALDREERASQIYARLMTAIAPAGAQDVEAQATTELPLGGAGQ